jgi:hypothetical protein
MKTCNYSINIFQEAINHCRWKTVLQTVIQQINISDYHNNTFEEIIFKIYTICKNVYGIGMLTIYDITFGICRYHNINIDKVYIIGKGPKKAVNILNIKTKTQNINNYIKIKYVNIIDIINAFDVNNYKLDKNIRNTRNGDILETFICNWQKNKSFI